MTTIAAFPRTAIQLTMSPWGAWSALRDRLQTQGALVWQLVGASICLLALMLRVSALVGSNREFEEAGITAIVGLAMSAELIAFAVYLIGAGWLLHLMSPVDRPRLTASEALSLVACTGFPLLLAWVFRVAVAWLRPSDGLALVSDFHSFVEAVWAATTLRADLGVIISPGSAAITGVAATLGLFWLWHWLTLWGALRVHLGWSTRWAAILLCMLFALVLLANVTQASIASSWTEMIAWSD